MQEFRNFWRARPKSCAGILVQEFPGGPNLVQEFRNSCAGILEVSRARLKSCAGILVQEFSCDANLVQEFGNSCTRLCRILD